ARAPCASRARRPARGAQGLQRLCCGTRERDESEMPGVVLPRRARPDDPEQGGERAGESRAGGARCRAASGPLDHGRGAACDARCADRLHSGARVARVEGGSKMNPNEPESRGGLPAILRAIGVLAVLALALLGILAVLDVIPMEELRQWFTKAGLVLAIVVATVIALFALARSGGKP